MKALGWGVAIVAIATTVWLGIRNQQLSKQVAAEQPEAAPASAEPERALPVEPPPVPVADPVETAAAVTEETAEPEAHEDPEKKRERDQRERVMKAQLSIVIDMAYQPLYDELNIAPDTVEAMRELMVETANRDRIVVEKAMKTKDTVAREVKSIQDENKAWLYDELSKVLSKEELAGYEAYEDYAEQILYESLLDGQLTMMARGLTPEGRETVKEVFAEELVVAINAYESSDELYTMDGFNDAQLVALHAGLQRLRFSVSPDQYDQAAGFVSQVEQMFQAMSDRE